MAENTRIISGGTNYYLAGPGSGSYTGSGTPWTAQTTTPYRLSLNDDTGNIWTPQAAPAQAIYSGGPPFRIGQSLVTRSYGNVTETVGIQMRGSTHDNAVALLRQLRQILNTALYSSPAILAMQANNSTNVTYFEIYSADVQELPSYLVERPSGAVVLRAAITWTRSIGSAGALTTLLNGASWRNRSSSSPDDVESLGSLAGDLVNEGQPLNIRITPTAGNISRTLYLATVQSRVNTSIANSQTTSSSANYTSGSATITNARNQALKIRILARFDTFTNADEAVWRAEIRASGSTTFFITPFIALPDASATSTLLDFGYIDVRPAKSMLTSSFSIDFLFSITSTTGASVTARLDYVETLLYYTFANVQIGATTADTVVIEQANDYNVNSVVTPNATPRVYQVDTATGVVEENGYWRGTLPRAYSGASLYAAWLSGLAPDREHDTTDTADVTVQHLPLYHSLRGGS